MLIVNLAFLWRLAHNDFAGIGSEQSLSVSKGSADSQSAEPLLLISKNMLIIRERSRTSQEKNVDNT